MQVEANPQIDSEALSQLCCVIVTCKARKERLLGILIVGKYEGKQLKTSQQQLGKETPSQRSWPCIYSEWEDSSELVILGADSQLHYSLANAGRLRAFLDCLTEGRKSVCCCCRWHTAPKTIVVLWLLTVFFFFWGFGYDIVMPWESSMWS